MAVTECIYIHGFASGPSSSKAQYFSGKLKEAGIKVHVPDMNGGNFSDLTLTNQLEIIEALISAATDKLMLVGSSMGGLLSVLSANRYPAVKALVLLAPGFGLNRRWNEMIGAEQFSEWQRRGTLDVFHHGAQCELPLKYSFIEDAERYQTDRLKVAIPTLVMHGVNDTVVPCDESRSFALLNQSLVEFHPLQSDHGLLDCLPELWELTMSFMLKHQVVSADEIGMQQG